MNHFFRHNPLFPFLLALAVVLLSLICFDFYRLTRWVWVPAMVVFPFAALVWAFCWSFQESVKDRRARCLKQACAEISMEEGVFVLATPVLLKGDEKEVALEWLSEMPKCVKEQLREAYQFAQMVNE